jgi:hypothetical protein
MRGRGAEEALNMALGQRRPLSGLRQVVEYLVPLDQHYINLQTELRATFKTLNLAA